MSGAGPVDKGGPGARAVIDHNAGVRHGYPRAGRGLGGGLSPGVDIITGVRQCLLDSPDVLPEVTGSQKAWAERAGRVLADRRELAQRGGDVGIHPLKLPGKFLGSTGGTGSALAAR